MTLRLVQLPLHLKPDQALTVIDFLEHLQTLLWNHYGDAIQRDLQKPSNPADAASGFDDPVPF